MNLSNVERKFVFKVSRGLFLLTTIVIGLGLVGSTFFFLYTMTPSFKGAEPAKPSPPPAPQISAADINALIQKQTVEATPVPVETAPIEEYEEFVEPQGDGISPQDQIDDLIEQVRNYFPAEGFPWRSTWKQKGVKDRISWSYAYLKDQDRIAFLKTVLKFLAIMPPELQYSTVQSVGDICRAYRSPAPDVYDMLYKLIKGELGLEQGAQPVPLTTEQRADLLDFIFKITKRKTPSETFKVVLDRWNGLRNIIPADRMKYTMVAMWKVIEGMEASQASLTITAFEKILPEIAPENQISALYIYQRLLYQKTRNQQQEFQRKMSEYRSEIARQEAAYNAKVMSKKKFQKIALYGIGSTIVGIAFLGLLLALLGIERNTRTLQAVLESMKDNTEKSSDRSKVA